ncbi:MAG: chemotaxis protein CheX [Myxococcales bacterium]
MTAPLASDFLEKVTVDILERAAYVFADLPEDEPALLGAALVARLDFSGPQQGAVTLATTPSLAGDIAANMLGEEPGGAAATAGARDALAELLNVLSGALMVQLFGSREVCTLGMPQVRDAEGWDIEPGSTVAAWLLVEGAPMAVSVKLGRG